MSSQIEKVKVSLSKVGETPSSEATLEILRFSQGDRLTRAGKLVALFLALALGAVFIPVLHFFLVPLFLVLAGIMGFITYYQEAELKTSLGLCPYCQTETSFKKGSGKLPFNDTCEHCSQLIMVKCL